MDIDSHSSARRAKSASSPKHSAATSEAWPNQEDIPPWPVLMEALRNLPDSRPEAVERARNLIADPDYPPQHLQEILAQQLAILVDADIDSLPT
jgi:hypothetical protein